MNKILIHSLILFIFFACDKKEDNNNENNGILQLSFVKAGDITLNTGETIENIPLDGTITIKFNSDLNPSTLNENISLTDTSDTEIEIQLEYNEDDFSITATPVSELVSGEVYILNIGTIESTTGAEFSGSQYKFIAEVVTFGLTGITANNIDLSSKERAKDLPLNFRIEVLFEEPVKSETNLSDYITIRSSTGYLSLHLTANEDNKRITITSGSEINYQTKYTLKISSGLKSDNQYVFEGFEKVFYTQIDSSYKFDKISDEELLTKIQEQTFKYFWDFAHPASGLARERNTSGDVVTIGGSGFGIMTIPVAIERGFITRKEGIDRMQTIVNFLAKADRFHGVWPHWMDGNTGEVVPFSSNDDGGDLVETSFMIQGLLTVREYLSEEDTQESAIRDTITSLWENVEWDWYTQNDQDVLYWHWSPNYGWEKNHQISGWNEALIVYVLAASSPTHPIDADVYHSGWAKNGNMKNGNTFFSINLPLGSDYGGPLFFEHYSFLGLNPTNLSDTYADYWEQAVAHSKINHAYCGDNPKNWVGYSDESWGLTASDNDEGYSAHSPTNDLGVITPTAAISSIPYTPELSMAAIHHFYYILGDKLWGTYGFYDAFNFTENWVADSYIAIDQGPIIIMIENYRTGLLWQLFMSAPEIQQGLTKLGFTY